MKQPSDFRMGVEAAAKWLRDSGKSLGLQRELVELISIRMVATIGDDPEGTEARTVAQIVQYLRETSFGHMDEDHRKAIVRAAAAIERLDWKRT